MSVTNRPTTATGVARLLPAATLSAPAPAAAHPISAADFQQVQFARGTPEVGGPMSLAVLPDRSVLHAARNGTLRRTDANGSRNPFRMSVDKATGVVYVGDYGPDAGATSARGPQGQVEFNRVTGPGFYAWPYCTGANTGAETYAGWNLATNAAGPKYNCSGGPTNNSFRNTGLSALPSAKPAWIRYGGDAGSPSAFGGGAESPMAGPVYRYDPALSSPTTFPQAFDGQFFALYRFDHVGGGNRAPIAVASADKTSGQAPLTVTFSSAGSSDPEGRTLMCRATALRTVRSCTCGPATAAPIRNGPCPDVPPGEREQLRCADIPEP